MRVSKVLYDLLNIYAYRIFSYVKNLPQKQNNNYSTITHVALKLCNMKLCSVPLEIPLR